MSKNSEKHLELWKKSLLDISGRNRSINFKRSKTSTLQIVSPAFQDFFALIGNGTLTFGEMFKDEEFDTARKLSRSLFEKEYVTIQGINLEVKDVYTQEELLPVIEKFRTRKANNLLFSLYNNKTQRTALRNLMKKSLAFKEENAINVLYFAIGYLEWYENKDSKISYRSPLLFVPAEISQEGVDSPFKITFKEGGELQLNDSLIRKLNSDYKLDIDFDLTADLSEAELYSSYKNLITTKIRDPRWKIIDEIDLGIFSFSKINMVKDLEENAQRIMASPLIQKIIGEGKTKQGDVLVNSVDVDSLIKPENYFHILDADSSQEAAILSALSGKSFVLQGPPGTGKSQTITNIITELIARGKKVLFVAEKKAALDIVYNNLKQIGLSDFALPIHNSKLDKKEVIRELNAQLEKGKITTKVNGDFVVDALTNFKSSKARLKEYSATLLKPQPPLNKSLYEMYGLYLNYQAIPTLQFAIPNFKVLDSKRLGVTLNYIEELYQASKAINFDLADHPFFGLKAKHLSVEQKETFKDDLIALTHGLEEVNSSLDKLTLFNPKKPLNIKQAVLYTKALTALYTLPKVSTLLFTKEIDDNIANLKTLIEYDDTLSLLKNRIEEVAQLEVTLLDIENFKIVLKDNRSFFKRLTSKEYKKVFKVITSYTHTKKLNNPGLLKLVQNIDEYNTCSLASTKLLVSTLGSDHNVSKPDLEEHLKACRWYKAFSEDLTALNFINKDQIITDLVTLNKAKTKHLSLIRNLDKQVAKLNSAIVTVNNYFRQADLDLTKDTLSDLQIRISTMIRLFPKLDSLLAYNLLINKNKEFELEEFCEKIASSKFTSSFSDIYLKRFYTLLVDHYVQALLPGFSGTVLDNARLTFKEAEQSIAKMAKINIESRISEKIPNYNSIEGKNAEVTVLRAEANKSRKLLPFRVLFNKIPNLITTLKPLLMMSPLSVSTFLRGSNMEFDVVIFDEASQVKPENAIGAIFRAKQFIVTGDKEQLPPTTFFMNVDVDDTFEEDNLDTSSFDSILDVASTFLNTITLKWHYRSKFEELIRPSNEEIYNDLITFPSSSKPKGYEGVKFDYVPGVYSERRNALEADRVLRVIRDIIITFGYELSVGVVTFNSEQQALIEQKINLFRRSHPEFDNFFLSRENEPFFVKNIESVQGDERDIIIMSVGYGPDKDGKISMNFGPLNMTGGYRRLNVAVTRAKQCLILISSVRSSDIDLSRSDARGVKFLKNYLEYAESGGNLRFEENDNESSLFARDVYQELTKRGFVVKLNVGVSLYRIDLAIVNPNDTDNYLVGIEIDGPTYSSSASVRDRDRLRQEVLEMRGWKLYRLWSTDWVKNKDTALNKLLAYIHNVTNGNIAVVKNNQDVPVIQNERLVEPEFLLYPHYPTLFANLKNTNLVKSPKNIISEMIEATSPLHFDEFRKLVPQIWGNKKYTNVIDSNVAPILKELKTSGVIKEIDNYLVYQGKEIVFQKTTTESSKRDFKNIHKDELKDGILKIVKLAKKIQLISLQSTILENCGLKVATQQVATYFELVIEELLKEKRIRITNSNVESYY